MTIRNLEYLFKPKSIAVIGASDTPHSVGATVMRNLLQGGFSGPITPVNPKYRKVAGVRAFPSVASLEETPDLAVICTPPQTVPGLIAELGSRGTKAAVVLSAGLAAIKDGRSLQQTMLEAARPHLLRILGPNCVGLLIPGLGVNASFAHTAAQPGTIAFVSQSGALTTALLDWAKSNDIGFSHFISLGDSADVDFGDVLDNLANDPGTRAILLYIESVKHARKFMSAARAAARNKPVIAVKAGRAPEGAKAAASHTGALAGSDDVYDAAIRRAGMLRVNTTLDLFNAVETLARAKPISGERLTIMTNGGGPGVMATDVLMLSGGKLAQLSEGTLRELDEFLPPTWSHGNPVDIIGDAPAERYVQAMKVLLHDPQSDAVLFLHAPTAIVPSEQIAEACAKVAKDALRNVLACWVGGEGVEKARRIFVGAGIPTYDTPEEAVRGFLQMVEYRRNQEMLMETPASAPLEFSPDIETARRIVKDALASQNHVLSEPQAKAVVSAYGIPVVETRSAQNGEEALRAARELGFPVALKILSPDVTHKSDVGGVMLNLESEEELERAIHAMSKRLRELRPNARFSGFTVQKMVRKPGAHELIVGAATDLVFGPVVLFGQGGTAVEVIGDRAVALPPLNMALAKELVSRTRVSKLLAGYRDRPAADREAVYLTLMQVAQLVADVPEIAELDINPLLADEKGVIALDARIRVAQAKSAGPARLAIRPYPKELEEWIALDGRQVLVRPIRPEDEPQFKEFLARISPEDIHFRFFHRVRDLPHTELARFTQIDYEREMSFIAADGAGRGESLGEVRAVADPDNMRAEFAIMVRSDIQGQGLGHALLEKMIRYCRARGTGELFGEVLSGNERMLALAEDLGFEVHDRPDPQRVRVRLKLQPD